MKITDKTMATLDGGAVDEAATLLRTLADTFEDEDASEAIIFRAAATLAEKRAMAIYEKVF